jgi:hypothetical protein
MFSKTLSTKGIIDKSGEQVEVFSAGDRFKTMDNEHVVSFIEWNREDPNDFILYYIDNGVLRYTHRMDAERVEAPEVDVLRSMLSSALDALEHDKNRLNEYEEDYQHDHHEDTRAMIDRTNRKIRNGETRINALRYAIEHL